MKYFILILLLFISFYVKANDDFDPRAEIFVGNWTQEEIYVKFYPVGAVFNGNANGQILTKYSLKKYEAVEIRRRGYSTIPLIYIIGLDGFALSHSNPTGFFNIPVYNNIPAEWNNYLLLSHDATDHLQEWNDGIFGYGYYRLEIYNSEFTYLATINFDWLDFRYSYPLEIHGAADLYLRIYNTQQIFNTNSVKFRWASCIGCGDIQEISVFGSTPLETPGSIQVFKQYHYFDNNLSEWVGYNLNNEFPPLRGNSVSDINFLTYPLDGRNLPSPYNIPQHPDAGLIRANVSIDTNVNTPTTLLQNPTNITISNKAIVKVESADTLNLLTPTSPSNSHVNLIVTDSSFLAVRPSAKIIVHSPNKITLKNTGTIIINTGGEIKIKPGALFCNEGGKLFGRVTFENGFHQPLCSQLADFFMQDSSKFILDSNAILPIPNNTTLHLKGNTTSLIMKPGSKLLFGENSGIVCDSGGKVIANNATFASIDSTKKWNGISLSGLSQDTIRNCIIKNAAYGISISNKYDFEESSFPYSTEISGCTFINQTNYVLNSGVYIAGSNNVLIMNNSVSSSALEKGFTHGIYAEYCPEGAFNIIGNNISNAGFGMTLIGCSPFVAQNTITGNEFSDCGLFLDNSNGTFEYNLISDFYYSYFSYYSSPDLLKNVFDNYYDDNIWLSSSSVPVMHPLINAGSVYWYAGDNTIKGSPSEAGIIFEEDAYPMLNYGYNKFMMINNDYYISGTNPSGGNREFYVLQNYWGGTPDSNKFNVANADVIYIPYDNNSSSARETNSDDKFDIGFGLYDTVFYYEPDNPNSAQDLYLEAYQKEYAGEFSQAIEIYKEIVEEYKDSSYTSSCMSRIFSCFEKKNSAQSEYSSLESYYSDISNDTTYSEIQRNIAEEFMIKSKVKQNNIEEAISDYTTIYSQNTSTPKGIHAFINKEILSQGTRDNMTGSSVFENIELSQNAINTILSKLVRKDKNIFRDLSMKPNGYSMSQNFPNPFNPSTVIRFSVPHESIVSIKVFDVTGKTVAVLVNNRKYSQGYFDVTFNSAEFNLTSGIYFYKLETADFKEVKRMVLIK